MAFLICLIAHGFGRMFRWNRSDRAKDLEILVLRHQLKILGRRSKRPLLTTPDRALLAAVARMLPRERWSSFLVSPRTLLRWHREPGGKRCLPQLISCQATTASPPPRG